MTAFALLLACCASAQVDSVTLKLKSLGIDSNIIEHSFHTDDGIHSFKVTINAVSPSANNYTTIEYDPQRDESERWQMVTFNNDTVSERWAHDYAKEVNKKRGATIAPLFRPVRFRYERSGRRHGWLQPSCVCLLSFSLQSPGCCRLLQAPVLGGQPC